MFADNLGDVLGRLPTIPHVTTTLVDQKMLAAANEKSIDVRIATHDRRVDKLVVVLGQVVVWRAVVQPCQ